MLDTDMADLFMSLDCWGLGPCDLSDPVWGKMSAVPGSATKKRKKTDAKPQSQINKCLNEKRRREQENIYIEELAELISASFADMNSLSVKPDKCAILQETVNQIRHIKEQENNSSSSSISSCTGGGGSTSVGATSSDRNSSSNSNCNSDAVQQGEVSSSNPTVLRNEVFGPLLLEALDGFLFVVNVDARIEFCTENVHQFIQFTRDDVLGKSIYNFIHHGDHARFSSSLLPISIGWSNDQSPQNSRRTFTCRLLVKPPEDQDSTMEEKQQRIIKYENMQIQCTQVQLNKDKGDVDDVTSDSPTSQEVAGLSLMCVARRIPQNEKAVGTPIEQFSMKLDTTGKILGIDTFGVSALYSQYLNKDLTGQIIQEICHPEDLQKLSGHLKDALGIGSSTSAIYRLRVAATPIAKFLHVRTVSKLFKSNANSIGHESDFIMATHSIIGENDLTSAEVQNLMTSPSTTSSSGLGGPLMGGTPGPPPPPLPPPPPSSAHQSSSHNFTTNTTSSYDLSLGEFDFLSSTSSWDVAEGGADSRSSLTPRPPSVPVYSPPPANSFPFSPLPADEHRASNVTPPENNPAPPNTPPTAITNINKDPQDSGRLRGLLTGQRRLSSSSSNNDDSENNNTISGGNNVNNNNRHRILKGLLNQEEDEEVGGGASTKQGRGGSGAGTTNNNNIMLLKLLNEKSDDDDVESRAGLKKQNELLQQLLKEQGDERKTSSAMNSQQEDSLLRSLGFRNTSSPSPPSSSDHPSSSSPAIVKCRKRSSGPDNDSLQLDGPSPGKRSSLTTAPAQNTPRTGELWEKNKMLASLLAKESPKATQIPPIPTSVISATPQDKLPKIDRTKAPGWTPSQPRPMGGKPQQQQRPPPPNQFLSQLHHQDPNLILSKHLTNPQTIAPPPPHQLWDAQTTSSDPILSDLLDQVIDIVPDAVCTDSTQIIHLLDQMDQSQQAIQQHHPHHSHHGHQMGFEQDQMSERMAINAIQKSLMQCESAVKSPSSPGSAAYSAQSPGGYPPPPMYQQVQQQQRPTVSRFAVARVGPQPQQQFAAGIQQQQQQLLQRKMLMEQQKQRLLQAAQQQQVLIPSNVSAQAAVTTVPGEQPGALDSLLNNTVAPNVSLQRSQSTPEAQLSPGYTNQLLTNGGVVPIQSPRQQQQQTSQQQPYSPHSPQGWGQPSPARLSPHTPGQLSPRITQGPQQTGYTVTSQQQQQQTSNWQQPTNNRLNMQQQQQQQQQNPMLNAQLGAAYGNGIGRFTPTTTVSGNQPTTAGRGPVPGQPAGRTLTSPGPPRPPSGYDGGFPPPPPSPSAYGNPPVGTNASYRLQRTISAPPLASSPANQLPGGLLSPRHYGLPPKEMAPPFAPPDLPPHNHFPSHHHQMLYHHHHHHHHSPHHGPYNNNPPPTTVPYESYDMYGARLQPPPPAEYVRQELRAVVGARTQQQQNAANASNNNTNTNNNNINTSANNLQQTTSTSPHIQQVPPADLEALGLSFEMPSGPSESPKIWGTMGADLGAGSPQPGISNRSTTMEDTQRMGDQKSSLLQKLLSE